MIPSSNFPEIRTVFDIPSDTSSQLLYGEVIRNILKTILPAQTFQSDDPKEQHQQLDRFLPLVTSTPIPNQAGDISFYAILNYRSGAFKFFYEMLTHWLVPGQRLNVVLVYAADFRFPQLSQNVYTLCDVMIRVEESYELTQIKNNFPVIATELRLGLESAYHARRILEVKGLSADLKTALIQEYIFHVIKRVSNTVDHNILTEMQHVLVMCSDDFKMVRDSRHLSRIILAQYFFRKAARNNEAKEKRHIAYKLFRSLVQTPQGEKEVLSVFVGITLLKEHEVFDQRHLLGAIQALLPQAKLVESSFFSNRFRDDNLLVLYLEVVKENEENITTQEMTILKHKLSHELKSQIGYVMNPVFMPRNEEEIMRNILILCAQIKFARDIPQLSITFDEQTQEHLYFTIIAVRVVCPGNPSIQDLFRNSGITMEYIHDRCKSIGILRKKHAKEATVFRVKLSKRNFLRRDQTIDLYKARQEVVFQLVTAIGEFRDFNGGMISKQGELLDKVKKQLVNLSETQEMLLDNFFYSLTPVVMRTVLEPEALVQLFQMQLEALRSPERQNIYIKQTPTHLFVIIKTEDSKLEEILNKTLEPFDITSTEQAASSMTIHDICYYGYIYRNDDPVKQWQYQQALRHAIAYPLELTLKENQSVLS